MLVPPWTRRRRTLALLLLTALLAPVQVGCGGGGKKEDPPPPPPPPIVEDQILQGRPFDGRLFGGALALEGDRLLVGASGRSGPGDAHVFVRGTGGWTEQTRLVPEVQGSYDAFGTAVALEGDTALIGAPAWNDKARVDGYACIFTWDGEVWRERVQWERTDPNHSSFGDSVAISGDTALVGASRYEGAVYVYRGGGADWVLEDVLTAPTRGLGTSVAIVGDTAFVGTPFDEEAGANTGAVFVFSRTGSTWTQTQKLFAASPRENDWFGWRLAVSGDTVVVGGYYTGAAHVFVRSGTTWTQQARLGKNVESFGRAVSLSGDSLLIGAPGASEGCTGCGAAYLYTRSGTEWTEQERPYVADEAAQDSEFAASVAVSDAATLIGAPEMHPIQDLQGRVYAYP